MHWAPCIGENCLNSLLYTYFVLYILRVSTKYQFLYWSDTTCIIIWFLCIVIVLAGDKYANLTFWQYVQTKKLSISVLCNYGTFIKDKHALFYLTLWWCLWICWQRNLGEAFGDRCWKLFSCFYHLKPLKNKLPIPTCTYVYFSSWWS